MLSQRKNPIDHDNNRVLFFWLCEPTDSALLFGESRRHLGLILVLHY
jgi:hypothetical protein